MKILLINHFPLEGSGSGVYTKNIADGLVEKGHEVCIIMPENKKVEVSDSKIKIHPVYFKGEENMENQISFNFPCFTTHPRSSKTFYDLTEEELNIYINYFTDAIEEEISKFKPDIIHVGHIWLLSSIATNYDIPVVITVHGTDLVGYNMSDRYHECCLNAVSKSSKIITISKENYELVLNTFENIEQKVKLIPNGYNKDVFYPEIIDKNMFLDKFNINREYKHIVSYVGKFTELKGIDVLLKAATIYENDDVVTILAGDGELFEEMNNLAQTLNLKNVKFIRNQPHYLLRELYNIADVSIVPSRKEAFGLVAIEALACGTPVIASKEGGLIDIINENIGVLFEKDNYQELGNIIFNVLNNKIDFDRNYISKYTKEKYSQEQFIEELIDIYETEIKN